MKEQKQLKRKIIAFSTNSTRMVGHPHTKYKNEYRYRPDTTHTSFTEKAADQTVKYKIIYFLEGNVEENLGYLRFGDNVLDTVLRVQCIKETKFVLY